MKMFETYRLIILCGLFVFTIANELTSENPIVQAPIGKIRGSILMSRLGKKIYSFRGVRYAEPPVGENRFKVATPAKDWNDIYDGTQEGPACTTLSKTPISEDCLLLNVYTTKLPSQNAKGKNFKGRPVLFFIHPGAFYVFSGQSRFFGPQYILDKDIVLVTINHRLGTLGFISSGDSHAPGNLGLKDQVVALRWVQRNIAAFGGDPNCVTIGGYSIGSTSVLLHMLSPMSKGLFHRAIAMSGSDVILEPYPRDQKHLIKKQAELLDCPTDTIESTLTCLKSKPVENFTDTMSQFFEYYGDPILIWSPVVEPKVDGVERFLSAQPADLIREGKINKVPLIIGFTEEEFGGVVYAIDKRVQEGNTSILDNLNTKWNTIAPLSFMYERNTPRSNYISQQLKEFYFGNETIGTQSYDGIAHIYADSVIIFPVHRVTKLMGDNNVLPVYYYQFSYKGRFSFAMWNDTTPYKGPVHQDDLQYLFYMSAIFPYFNQSDPEIAMVELYTTMWTNFIQTGEPIPTNNEKFKNIKWERFETPKDNYLDITLNPVMKQGVFPERMAVWERLFPLPPLPCPVKYQNNQ
ncbi:esterase E4-like [Polistes fuscatus]|uniref:esterase E4-like n=1 Tax=Polistes fuscatus TaxID=30207 RepID=UPI001CA9DABF|nr:esterase E4-like [Polistes fuscatus]